MDNTQGFDARPRKETNPADVQLGEIFAEITTLLDNAVGVTWYEESGNAVDQAVVALCRLRRAGAASRGGPEAGDVAVRAQWDQYMQAYEEAITATSTEWAPWYVLPADNKHVMQALTATIIVDTIASLSLEYPTVSDKDREDNAKARQMLEAEPE